MNKKISLKIPGRICILGDKIDLLGKPVIAMAINLMMIINFKFRNDGLIEFYSHDTKERTIFELGESPPRDIDLGYWSVLYERLKDQINQGFYLEVISEIPIGCGLSTSAAVSVGFVRALNEAYKLNLNNSLTKSWIFSLVNPVSFITSII